MNRLVDRIREVVLVRCDASGNVQDLAHVCSMFMRFTRYALALVSTGQVVHLM